MLSGDSREQVIRSEFTRAASHFADRTSGRFDHLDVVRFSRVEPGQIVAEIGAGTGNFLSLFSNVTDRLVAVDLTPAMLAEARRRGPDLEAVAADGARLPLASKSIELAASAQTLHHIARPVSVLLEMRRIVTEGGRVLVVDQVAPEHYEQLVAMNELEVLRDPSHAASRPPSAFRMMLEAAGLQLIDERVVGQEQRLSNWMWPGEFPEERIAAVRAFIAARGPETGMDFMPDGDDYVFTRRRTMLLAERGPAA